MDPNSPVLRLNMSIMEGEKKTQTKQPSLRFIAPSQEPQYGQQGTEREQCKGPSPRLMLAGSHHVVPPCSEPARADLEPGLGRILQKLGSELHPSWRLK